MALKINDTISSFTLSDASRKTWTFPTDAFRFAVLYFYPKDNSSGCTTEAKDFSALLSEFSRLDTQVFGISPDTAASHRKFTEKQALPVTLLSDPEKPSSAHSASGFQKNSTDASIWVLSALRSSSIQPEKSSQPGLRSRSKGMQRRFCRRLRPSSESPNRIH